METCWCFFLGPDCWQVFGRGSFLLAFFQFTALTALNQSQRPAVRLAQITYRHQAVAHSAGEYVKSRAHTNGIESVWAVLRRSLLGVYHWVSTKHLSRYLNEATFRLHEGNCQVDTLDRMVALSCGMVGKRLTYRRLIQDKA